MHNAENGKLGDETLEFFLRPSDQTQRFSISEFSVWGIVQKRNLGVEKNLEFDQNTLRLVGLILIKMTLFKVSLFRARSGYII